MFSETNQPIDRKAVDKYLFGLVQELMNEWLLKFKDNVDDKDLRIRIEGMVARCDFWGYDISRVKAEFEEIKTNHKPAYYNNSYK
jgi:hypothetical protein